MAFSSLTARFLMVASTSVSVLPVNMPPVVWVKSFRNCSSQHSNSCTTLSVPVSFVALAWSSQHDVKYYQSSLVPAGDMVGRFTFSTLAVAALAPDTLCSVAWAVIRAAATTGSVSGVSYGLPSIGHFTTGIFRGAGCSSNRILSFGR